MEGYEHRIGRAGSALPALVISKLPMRKSWYLSIDYGGHFYALAPFDREERAARCLNALLWLTGHEPLQSIPTVEEARDTINDLIGLSRASLAQETASESEAAR